MKVFNDYSLWDDLWKEKRFGEKRKLFAEHSKNINIVQINRQLSFYYCDKCSQVDVDLF